ncbi:MAG: gamma-glutamylcyclotransferase [Gammaproteobacteria bacterium]|jgi:gamma-glutamylcyclotransferase|nr:gamma-glutamylcyclotransferase [Gammaproteobacteria bacterium]MBT3722370.1 gamma-glutamylcyclotransferase [Gammaproteobacteria bacterium]MBT4075320.1 gamma-glutamylcyclotransferase [Gammaproteobacteria bacterium]MBT4193244.1 gamma-glutamylcyclotransferase [Gammaproteobacteria bacterium]MBT4450943.1 gamma-glutamylcyclotransferase [Gammaproteobacteria bacterium]
MMHYFAYGSNLHPVRLQDRVPSAKLISTIQLERHTLKFHKKSHDGSAKCNLIETGRSSDFIHGAIYELAAEHKHILDKFEGNGFGYKDKKIELKYQAKQYSCFCYFAQPEYIFENIEPYHWYKELVLLGAKYLKFPEAYISSIKSIKSVDDPDKNRRLENKILLQKILTFR